ncbi:MAG: CopD family protein [Pseudomonadota bacterium]
MAADVAVAQLAATVALNLSVAIVAGASMSTAWLRAGRSAWSAGCLGRLRLVALAAVTVAILCQIALLWLQAAAMAEVPVMAASPAVHAALTATHYGFAWTIGIGALAAIAAATALRRRPQQARTADIVALLGVAVFLYSRSIVSHAGAGGDVSWAVAADWLHLILISLWVGEVWVAGLVTLRRPADSPPAARADRDRYIQALSNTATVALAGIFVTGLASAWRGLGSLDNATGNDYAATLLIKLALVAIAALLGGINRFFVMPTLIGNAGGGTTIAQRRFALVLQIEAVVLLAALIFAAVLSSTSPPAAG